MAAGCKWSSNGGQSPIACKRTRLCLVAWMVFMDTNTIAQRSVPTNIDQSSVENWKCREIGSYILFIMGRETV